jgi:hypothetical protein
MGAMTAVEARGRRAWELREGEYAEVADVSGDDEWTAHAPYPVTVRPADLLE